MILITGGAGFIGSNLQAALARRGLETVIIDYLGEEGKWRNLGKHPPARLLPPGEIGNFLESRSPLEIVFHLGAITDTTAADGDAVWATNVELSRHIWHWCVNHGVRLVYASSAATYGDGSVGFEDDICLLSKLCPLNLYGWTKHAFDLYVAREFISGRPHPPQWVGLKFFNVYGPNEYHKGRMTSAVKVKYDEVVSGGPARLFRPPGISDYRRDFIWVGDVVDVLLWLYETPSVSGIFNVGTGRARTYLDLAHAVCAAADVPPRIEYIDLPESLRGQYQSFTEARIGRLRAAGYDGQFTSLEDGVRRYVKDYLSQDDPYE